MGLLVRKHGSNIDLAKWQTIKISLVFVHPGKKMGKCMRAGTHSEVALYSCVFDKCINGVCENIPDKQRG